MNVMECSTCRSGFFSVRTLAHERWTGLLKEMDAPRNPSNPQAAKLAGLARDLRVQAPRSVFAPLGPIPAVAARAVDKCRAELVGKAGAYHYDCPLDRRFFGFAGLDAEALKAVVATGADDQELANWMLRNASRRSAAAVIGWGKRFRLNLLLRLLDLDDWLHTRRHRRNRDDPSAVK